MRGSWRQAVLAVGTLAALHLGLALVPGPTISPATNAALFGANLYAIYCAAQLLSDRSGRRLGLFALGYLLLFLLLVGILERHSLFILLIIGYASVFHSRFLLGLFAIFVLSFVLLQPYAVESFVPLVVTYLALWRVRGNSLFVRICLGVGLLSFSLVLLPLIHLCLEDPAQTLWRTLTRPDVQDAVLMSLVSSTIATMVVALWGIPLAYALARTEFSGKSIVEAVVDVPILIPQSVAGIALMVLLGPGSPMGEMLGEVFGVQVAGRMVGIVLAQIFVSSPFLIKTAMTAFAAVPDQLEMASRTLGASPRATFWRIALPLASRGIWVGMILAWARAISEFGAIILFASSPVTAPVLVHTEFLRAGASESRPIAVLLLLICLWLFVLLQLGRSLLPLGVARRL